MHTFISGGAPDVLNYWINPGIQILKIAVDGVRMHGVKIIKTF